MTDATDTPRTCPGCDEAVGPGAYCERCGTEIEPASEPTERSGGMLVLGAPTSAVDTAEPAPADDERCECGGAFLDGYCEQCGSPRPDPRAHLTRDEQWVAGVTDIGVRRSANQDAFALTATDGTAAGVVCDGVGSAAFSEEASQAAADAALEVLTRTTSTGVGVPSSLVPALTARLVAATDAAADAVADVTERLLGPAGVGGGDTSAANPSCTLVAAVVSGATVVVGSVGDSRAYWIPDEGEAKRLTVDDSWAEERVAMGVDRAEAESGPGAHTITRWIGIDAPDHTPRTTSLEVETPGWLILCSDGLWNYASEADALAAVVRDIARQGADREQADGAASESSAASEGSAALVLSRDLVTWANAQGGHDNITVVAARLPGEKEGTDG